MGFFTQPLAARETVPHAHPSNEAGLMRVEEEYRLSEYAFNQASDEPTKSLRAHVGAVPPILQMSHAILVRVNTGTRRASETPYGLSYWASPTRRSNSWKRASLRSGS